MRLGRITIPLKLFLPRAFDCPVFVLKLVRCDSTAVLYTRADKSVPLQNGLCEVAVVDALIAGLCILALTPLLSLWMTGIRNIYPAYLLWGRTMVRLVIAAWLYWLRPRQVHWEPVGKF